MKEKEEHQKTKVRYTIRVEFNNNVTWVIFWILLTIVILLA